MKTTVLPLGVVLAGGASSRMGRDKASLLLGGITLAEHAARKLEQVCGDTVVADGGRGILAGHVSVADGDGLGPTAGILGAAAAHPGRGLVVLACDLPLVPTQLLAALWHSSEADWVLPRWRGGLEPLVAVYRPAALAALRRRALAGRPAPRELADEAAVAIHYLEDADLARFGPVETMFFNLNQPEDLRHLETLRCEADIALHPRFPEG